MLDEGMKRMMMNVRALRKGLIEKTE